MTDLRAELQRVADQVGSLVAPTADLLRRGRLRRSVWRSVTVGGAVGLVLVVSLTAVLLPKRLHPERRRETPSAAQLGSGRWGLLPPAPLYTDPADTLTWTGSRLVELAPHGPGVEGQGAASVWDPDTRRWSSPVSTSLGCRGWQPLAVEGNLFVWPAATTCFDRTAAGPRVPLVFDVRSRRWHALPDAPLPTLKGPAVVGALDGGVLVAGTDGGRLVAARYDLARSTWTVVDPPRTPGHQPLAVRGVETTSGFLLWSLWRTPATDGGPVGTDVWRLDDTWRNESVNWSHGWVDTPVVAGDRLVLSVVPRDQEGVLCPVCQGGPIPPTSYSVSPLDLHASPVDAGSSDNTPAFVWTGAQLLALNDGGGANDTLLLVDRGGRAARALPEPPAQPGFDEPVWGGGALYVLNAHGTVMTYVPGAPRRSAR